MKVVELYKPRVGPKLARSAPMKRGPKKRAKPSVLRSLRSKLWELCKAIIRKKYGNICYTCGKSGLSGGGWQTGHFVPRSVGGLALRYELTNLRPQCYRCNINLAGNGSVFYRKMVEIEGQAYVDAIFAAKELKLKETPDFFFDKIAEYKKILESL